MTRARDLAIDPTDPCPICEATMAGEVITHQPGCEAEGGTTVATLIARLEQLENESGNEEQIDPRNVPVAAFGGVMNLDISAMQERLQQELARAGGPSAVVADLMAWLKNGPKR
jgi:hypothetical protein